MPDRSAWTEDLRRRLATVRVSPEREREIIEELSLHLDQRYEELLAAGATEAEARRVAIEELQEPEVLANWMRPLRQANSPAPLVAGAPRRFLLGDLWQDLRYAARMLRKAPGFSAAAILTLALGIGANSAIFALVDATLLRPLPFPHPHRLVMVYERSESSSRSPVSPLNLADWNSRSRSFDVIAGYVPNVGGMVMSGADGTAQTVPRQWVTAGIFDALGIKAVVGRTFVEADDIQRANVVVLGEAFWRSRFNGDQGIVGRDIRLDGEPFTVVGVVPKEAELLGRSSMWAVRPIQGLPPAVRGFYGLRAIGRMKPGVTLQAARSDLEAVASALAQEFPKTNHGRSTALERLDVAVVGTELRQSAILFLGVVGFVLLICCGNVANLLLTRATVRRRELAVRSALGADRRRVIRQLLTESLLISVIGTGLGMALGAMILAAAPALIPTDLMPSGVTLTFDSRVVIFCAATAVFVGCLFGLAPAWQATAFSSAQVIAADDGRTTTGGGSRLRALLVVAEVATAVVLLFGGGLLLRTLLELENVDRGYQADSVLTMIVDPLGSSYPTPQSMLQFYESVEREVAGSPGVRSVAWASTLPMGPSYEGNTFFEIAGADPVEESQRPVADYQIVSPGYFSTVELPLVAGRGFDSRDSLEGVPVCLVNEAFVRRHLQGRDPIGVRLTLRPADSPQADAVVRDIVGVVRQVKSRPDETEELLQIYIPLAQDTIGDIYMVVTPVSGPADALASTVRAAIGRVDTEQLVSVRDIMTLEDVARDATSRHRFRAVLVMAFAGLALLLAMIGLFGVLSYTVQQRIREFGVRRALGATPGDVLRLVAGSAARVIGLGAVVGLALAALSSQLIVSMLFGVQPLDPVTFASVVFVLVITAALSIAAPAWRAIRVDPVVALRTE